MSYRTPLEAAWETSLDLDMTDLILGDYDAMDARDAEFENRARTAAGLSTSDRPLARLG